MLLAVAGIRSMFSIKWRDRTHPSLMMGVTAMAVGLTAVPLRCAGHPDQGPPHPGFFIAIALLALVFASSCVATALGRMVPERLGVWHPPTRLLSQKLALQAFPQNLSPEALDDIANTYKGVWEAIQAAHSAGNCTSKFIRAQIDRLRELAARVDTPPTADAIRADADVFNRRARSAARSSDSAPAQYIRAQCHLRFAAATTIANYRRGG
ncbi:MAG: hypothetical protein F4153_08885 [Acidimicrobiia bacterium]|nr:hypothetical protein [Acidimicrobiia bacterium]